jgi:chaperonin GroES
MITNNDKVIVEVIEEKEQMKGSIYIPSAVSVPLKKGIVVATGPGRVGMNGNIIPVGVKPGDRIIFPAHAGMVLSFKKDKADVTYLVMPEIEILGVFENNEE